MAFQSPLSGQFASPLPRWLAAILLTAAPVLSVAGTAPAGLSAPQEAVRAHELVLMWQKPDDYRNVRDYLIYLNDKPLETASANAERLSALAPYRKAFYARAQGTRQVQADIHAITLDHLQADSDYKLTVRALSTTGDLSAASEPITVHTAAESASCDIRQHGARGDGKTLDTAAIQATIDACPAGGTVTIPVGQYLSGALFLKSHLTLDIQSGATLLGSLRAEDYPLAKGYMFYPYSKDRRPPSLINVYDPSGRDVVIEDVHIVGSGVVDGSGWHEESPALIDETGQPVRHYLKANRTSVDQIGLLAANQVAAARAAGLTQAQGYSIWRSSLLTVQNAKRIFISGLSFRNPAYHGLMVFDSQQVTVRSVRVDTWDGNNGDGIEFGNSQNVSLSDSFFDTGDDCVNFAAGTGAEAAKQAPMEHAWIFDNYLRHGHGGIVIGSHTGAWIQDILAEDNIMDETDVGLRAKSNQINGGGGRRIVYRDNAHRNIRSHGMIITLAYADNNQIIDFEPAKTSGVFENIRITHNSFEYTPDWTPDPKAENNDGGKSPAQLDALQITGDVAHGVLHKNIVIDDLLLINAGPILINGLQDGVLRNIRYEGFRGSAPALTTGNAPGLKLENLRLPN